MSNLLQFPTEYPGDWAKFEELLRAALIGAGATTADQDGFLLEAKALFDEYNNLTIKFEPPWQELPTTDPGELCIQLCSEMQSQYQDEYGKIVGRLFTQIVICRLKCFLLEQGLLSR